MRNLISVRGVYSRRKVRKTMANYPPYAIVPTQAVAAAPAPSGSTRVSPPRQRPVAQQAVDMQFTQAVNQRRNLDKDIDDIRRKLEIKANECNKLQDQLNYMHSTTDQYKDKLAREKEILKDEHAGDIQRLKAEHDSARNESNDMLQQLIQQVKKQKAELEQRNLSKQSSELTLTEEIRRLQQENARLMVIADSCKEDANRSVNEVELAMDQQMSRVVEAEHVAAQKDEQMKNAKKEVAMLRESLEKVAKELVNRSKDRDGEIMRRQQQHELDARRMADELQSLIADKKELSRIELQQREEIIVFRDKFEKAKITNAELAQEIGSLQERLTAKEENDNIYQREIDDTMEQMELLKQENNSLHSQTDRTNEKCRLLQEEIQRLEENMGRVRNNVAEGEEELTAFHRDRATFASKMRGGIESAVEETRRLVQEVDDFRMQVRESVIMHAPEEARDVEMELLREQQRERDNHQRATAPLPNGDEHSSITLVGRLREDLIISWEDLRVIRSDVKDEVSRMMDLYNQHHALKDAYVVDREHLATLTINLNEANAAFSKLQKEKQILQDALRDQDSWMKDAVKTTNESNIAREQLISENDRIKTELNRIEDQGTDVDNLERSLIAVRTENERLHKDLVLSKHEKSDIEDVAAEDRQKLARMRNEFESMKIASQSSCEGEKMLRDEVFRASSDRDLYKEQTRKCQNELQEFKHASESENRQLRDELFDLKRLNTSSAEKLAEYERRFEKLGTDSEALERQLRSQRGVQEDLMITRDEADQKVVFLEEEKAQLNNTVSHLKRGVEAMWSSMKEAKSDDSRQLPVGSSTPRDQSPLTRMQHSPAITPVRGISHRAHSTQEDDLKDIEDRVLNLLGARKSEMSSWSVPRR